MPFFHSCGTPIPPRERAVPLPRCAGINLDAAVKITASDGESRVIGPGEILLVEDTSGKGHISQAVDGKFRHSVFVTLD